MTYNVDSAKQFACALDSLCPAYFRDSWIMSDIYSDLLYAESDGEVLDIMRRFRNRLNNYAFELQNFYEDVRIDLDAWIMERSI